jgi:hypothetical protein
MVFRLPAISLSVPSRRKGKLGKLDLLFCAGSLFLFCKTHERKLFEPLTAAGGIYKEGGARRGLAMTHSSIHPSGSNYVCQHTSED